MLGALLLPTLLGFAIFMLGMKTMELALHNWAGASMTAIVQRSTATPLHGLAVGTFSSALLQSSTAVTLVSIGMVNAGLLTYARTLGIILGTNIGTCLTTELLSLDLHAIAPWLLAAAAACWLFTALAGECGWWSGRRTSRVDQALRSIRYAALACGGFALLLSGMKVMQTAAPYVEASGLLDWFLAQEGQGTAIVWAVAAGAVFTALVHSSAAVIAMVMGFAAQGALTMDSGIALVLGANIGTCATVLLAALGASKAGQFVALSHTALNVAGALLFVPLLPQLAAAAAWLSSDPAAQIAHAQTIFNVVCSLLALPLCYLPALKHAARE